MKFDDLKISAKVMLPAIILAVVALLVLAAGSWQARQIEASQQILVDTRAPTELATARFSRQVATIGYAAYRTVANDGASQTARQASADLDKAYGAGNRFLDKAIAADPSAATDLEAFVEGRSRQPDADDLALPGQRRSGLGADARGPPSCGAGAGSALSRPGANPVRAAHAKLVSFAKGGRGGFVRPASQDWEEF